MTAAEFRIAREMLGVSGEWLAGRLGVADRQVRRWEAGNSPVPDGVAGELSAGARVEDVAEAVVTANAPFAVMRDGVAVGHVTPKALIAVLVGRSG